MTFVVFHVALRSLQDLRGSAAFADALLHTVSPLMCLLGWVRFGPRGDLDRRVALWSLAFPLAWLAVTLVRGAVDGFYPYPFLDVTARGYAAVAGACLLVAALFLGLAAGATWLDRVLARRSLATPVPETAG